MQDGLFVDFVAVRCMGGVWILMLTQRHLHTVFFFYSYNVYRKNTCIAHTIVSNAGLEYIVCAPIYIPVCHSGSTLTNKVWENK